jgi:hypothetical protein
MKSAAVGGAVGLDRLFEIAALDMGGMNVKPDFEVDPDVPVHRTEVCERVRAGAGQIA